MPLYEYACPACGTATERLRKYAEREEPIECPACGAAAVPVLSAAAVHAGGSAEAPRCDTGFGGGCCGGGCGMN